MRKQTIGQFLRISAKFMSTENIWKNNAEKNKDFIPSFASSRQNLNKT